MLIFKDAESGSLIRGNILVNKTENFHFVIHKSIYRWSPILKKAKFPMRYYLEPIDITHN